MSFMLITITAHKILNKTLSTRFRKIYLTLNKRTNLYKLLFLTLSYSTLFKNETFFAEKKTILCDEIAYLFMPSHFEM